MKKKSIRITGNQILCISFFVVITLSIFFSFYLVARRRREKYKTEEEIKEIVTTTMKKYNNYKSLSREHSLRLQNINKLIKLHSENIANLQKVKDDNPRNWKEIVKGKASLQIVLNIESIAIAYMIKCFYDDRLIIKNSRAENFQIMCHLIKNGLLFLIKCREKEILYPSVIEKRRICCKWAIKLCEVISSEFFRDENIKIKALGDLLTELSKDLKSIFMFDQDNSDIQNSYITDATNLLGPYIELISNFFTFFVKYTAIIEKYILEVENA